MWKKHIILLIHIIIQPDVFRYLFINYDFFRFHMDIVQDDKYIILIHTLDYPSSTLLRYTYTPTDVCVLSLIDNLHRQRV